MEQRAIGRSGISVSRLGVGGAPIGNLYRRVSDQEAALTVQAALDAGISYFDTAPYYGFGLSERRLGDALRGQRGIVISSKVGRLMRPLRGHVGDEERDGFCSALPFEPTFDYSRDGILRSHEASLQRLGLARIDILLIHDIGAVTHGERDAATFAQLTDGGGFRALEELRDGGTIGAFGLGVNEWPVCMRAMQHTQLDIVLLAGRYTLLDRDAGREFLPHCLREGIAVIAGGVFNSGILATGTRGATPYYNYAPACEKIVARVARLESICDAHRVSLPAAALQFTLAHPGITGAILGLGSPQQVCAAIASYRARIPVEFWRDLRSFAGLGDAPTPDDAFSQDGRRIEGST